MRTAEQIHAARFEKVVRAGMLADPDTQGAVRRATLDAAKAVTLYIGAGEVSEGLRVAKDLVDGLEDPHREIAHRIYESMRKVAGR